ncbi:MAG: glycosyltransferase family 2 protein [Candidatus Buchananbacteria bacterium]|jgi:hypothetical protein
MDKIDVSIVIVSWKVRELLNKCLESINSSRGDLQLEIFVVDNASNDGTVEMVKHDFPDVILIANHENAGFAKANNSALKRARGEYVLLLNPDTEIQNDTLIKSLEYMKRHSLCGALGLKMIYPDGRLQPSVRRFPKLRPIILMLLKIPKILPNLKSIENYLAKDFDYGREQTVDQIMGAYMFIPKAVLDKVGHLDERFFIWFEEVDFCRRLKSAGYEVRYFPDISIIHHGGKSFAQQALISNQKMFFMSALKYFLKYAGKNH